MQQVRRLGWVALQPYTKRSFKETDLYALPGESPDALTDIEARQLEKDTEAAKNRWAEIDAKRAKKKLEQNNG